jgi:homoserine dehydrogenase
MQALNVGIVGLGTVGASVVSILERRANALSLATNRNIRITSVSARDRGKIRAIATERYRWFSDPVELARSSNVDVLVEAMGGRDGVALDSINAALESGKHVVTANKALLAKHGMALARSAEEKNLVLNFEAVVAGGIPIIKQLREALLGNTIEKIYGILNGTCNYILTRMGDDNLSFENALKEAQRLGYAEADPGADIDAHDTAHKLAVLATLAFGIKLDASKVEVEGIRDVGFEDISEARQLGYQIKLLGIAERRNERILLSAHPALVPNDAPLSQVNGVLNAVSIKADAVDLTTIGPGAGGEATASAVVADIADIARGNGLKNPLLRDSNSLEDFLVLPLKDHIGSFYVRMIVEDKVGVFASIASHMAKRNISLESIKQLAVRSAERAAEKEAGLKSIVLITHETSGENIKTALSMIENDKFVRGKPKILRIER